MDAKLVTFLVVFGVIPALPSAPADGAVLRLTLDGDVLAAAAVGRGEAARGQDLAVFLAIPSTRGRPDRKAVWFKRADQAGIAKLVVARSEPVDGEAVAFDVCRLGPPGTPETLVLLRPDGLFRATGEPLIQAETLLAYRQRDELPRVRVCFDLFPGESQVVLLPVLRGVALYRQKPRFTLVATLPQLGELHVQGQPVRGEEGARTQRLALRLDLAEVSLVDYDGDGRTDICLSGGEEIACYLQQAGAQAFSATAVRRQSFPILSADERKDSGLRVSCHLVELSGDGRADLVIRRSQYGLSDMESTLYVYLQRKDGRFPAKPDQTLRRPGFFGYQEYADLDGDGRVDIIAPVAALGWSELAGIALRHSATIGFVWYRNKGDGTFAPEALPLHEMSWPVDFKNLGNILGSLPLSGTRLLAGSGRELVFFPEKKAIEITHLAAEGGLHLESVRTISAEVGADALPIDLNGDGLDELVLTDPRAPDRARTLLYVDTR